LRSASVARCAEAAAVGADRGRLPLTTWPNERGILLLVKRSSTLSGSGDRERK